MRILITGKNGQTGYELVRSLACLGDVIATGRDELNLAELDDLAKRLERIKPDIIINAAAYTAVDKAETDRDMAFFINGYAPEIMAQFAASRDIPLIHYSTDYVFDGQQQRPWRETDPCAPLNVYGASKLEGEQRIIAQGGNYLIFRTSWVYGLRGHNFLNTMKRLAAEKDQLKVVDDQYGAPTWARHLADAVAQVIVSSQQQADFWQKKAGIYHLSAQGKTSWHGFATAIFEQMKRQGQPVPAVHAIPSSDYLLPAKRPFNSCLDNTRLRQTLGIQLPDWQKTLELLFEP